MWYKTKTHVFQTSFTARRVKRGANEDDKWPATTEDGQTIVRIPYVESGTTSTDFFAAQSWIIVSLRNRRAERRGRQNDCLWQTWQAKFFLFLWWSSLKLMFSHLLKKGEVRRKLFSNKIIVTLVTQGLPSSFLSHPVAYHTTVLVTVQDWFDAKLPIEGKIVGKIDVTPLT